MVRKGNVTGLLPTRFLLVVFILFIGSFGANAFSASEPEGEEKFNPGEMIMHHVLDAHEWHLMDGVTIPLPVILYSSDRGLEVFMSSKFEHGHASHLGYTYEGGHIQAEDGHKFYDFSITKNVAQLFINVFILMLVFLKVASSYKKREGKAPKGLQSLIEPVIIFVRDDIAKPNIGKKYARYMPFLLTLFFFIWIGNLIGLMPGAANLTGNIAVTGVMATITLLFVLFSSTGYFWKHVFLAPGTPMLIKPFIIMVEIIGIFSKPISLMIRLFVAITAGHIVILSLIGLTFIFQSYFVGLASSFIVLFINLIELLVATIQAYVFTLFSALYIGMALDEGHH